MLKYFNKNDPYRIVALVFIIVVTRVLFFIFTEASQDSNTGQSTIFDSITFLESVTTHSGPLYNLIFAGIDIIDSNIINVIITALIILYHAVFLNSIFIRNASFEESSFVPAAIYVILMSASKEFYFLSPALVGGSFVLISLRYLLYHIKHKGSEENIISTGFTIGVACLIYYPFFWLYLFTLIVYLFYSSTITRRYFLMTWGFIMPILLTWLIYFLLDNGPEFLNVFFSQIVSFKTMSDGLNKVLTVFSFNVVLSLVSAIQSFSGLGMTNHQILVQKSMSWVGFFGIMLLWLFGNNGLSGGMLMVPALCYFSTKMFGSISKRFFAEFLFATFLVAAFATMLLGY